MRGKFYPAAFGLFLAFFSISLVAGSLYISSAEQEYISVPSNSLNANVTAFTQTPSLPPPSQTNTQVSPTITPTETQISSNCSEPDTWIEVTVIAGDSLEAIASKYQVSVDNIILANCKELLPLSIGSSVFVPPILPTSTATIQPPSNGCAPLGWVQYTIKRGDTLYSLHKAFQLQSIDELQEANCMGSTTTLITGTKIWVPDIVPIFPTTTSFDSQNQYYTKTVISFYYFI